MTFPGAWGKSMHTRFWFANGMWSLWVLVLFVFCVGWPAHPQDAPGDTSHEAVGVVRSFLANFAEVTGQDTLSVSEQLERLLPAMREEFDMDRLAAATVGYSRWKMWEQAQQTEYKEKLVRYLVCTYVHRFESERGDVWKIVGTEESERRVLVLVSLTREDTTEGYLSFLLLESEGVWKIVDVFLDNRISEAANWRSQFAGILKDGGVESLLARLEELEHKCESSSPSR